jgi:hypothetical protein
MLIRLLVLLLSLLPVGIHVSGQTVKFDVRFVKPFAVWEFIQRISENASPNPFQTTFNQSHFSTDKYKGLIAKMDSLELGYTYEFNHYPYGQKMPASIETLLKRNLIHSKDLNDFKSRSLGLIPGSDLDILILIIQEFTPVYEKIIYDAAKTRFEKQLNDITDLIKRKNIGHLFEQARSFYNSSWDSSLNFIFTFYPLPDAKRFTATAFNNVAVSALPVSLADYNRLLGVMLHEVSHILYDEQSLSFKKQMDHWFHANPSRFSQYAYLLLNESWATAVGNGFFFEKLSGQPDTAAWYNWKYNNLMAKQIYSMVKDYLNNNRPIDQRFVNNYITTYEQYFPEWIYEWDNLMTNRAVISETASHFEALDKKFRYNSISEYYPDFSQSSFLKFKAAPVTKLIVVSKNNKQRLRTIKKYFPELKGWRPNSNKNFTYRSFLSDKTFLIVINLTGNDLESEFEKPLLN